MPALGLPPPASLGMATAMLAAPTGEWWNGRHAGFRSQCPKGCGGSNPPSPTCDRPDPTREFPTASEWYRGDRAIRALGDDRSVLVSAGQHCAGRLKGELGTQLAIQLVVTNPTIQAHKGEVATSNVRALLCEEACCATLNQSPWAGSAFPVDKHGISGTLIDLQ
jgi:hypothetical protein